MLRKPTDELVIKPRLSGPVRLSIILGAIVVIAGSGFGGYWAGRSIEYEKLASTSKRINTLETRLRTSQSQRQDMAQAYDASRGKLEAELKATRDKLDQSRRQLEDSESSLSKVTRQLQIDEAAYQELRKQLDESNKQIAGLARELKFYRSIISPADGRSGVRIQDFELESSGGKGEYRYRLTLIQALEHEKTVKGSVRFEVNGTQDGAAKSIHVPDSSQEPISAEFKYFQNFAGTITLPEGFAPAEVKVIFHSSDNAVVERTYPWPMHGFRERGWALARAGIEARSRGS
ncbi:MAG: DUF6776 family protein [Arenicellales bacterium]